MSVTAAAVLGLSMGVRHAFEADHVAAVATFVSEGGSVSRAVRTGALWGLGHGAVVALVGGLLVSLGLRVPESLATSLELVVALVLFSLGIASLWAAKNHWAGTSRVAHEPHRHVRRPLAVGVLHGASGTGALVILAASTVPGTIEGLAFVGLFGVASVVAMSAVAGIMAWPLRRLRPQKDGLSALARAAAGLFSIGAAAVLGFTAWTS